MENFEIEIEEDSTQVEVAAKKPKKTNLDDIKSMEKKEKLIKKLVKETDEGHVAEFVRKSESELRQVISETTLRIDHLKAEMEATDAWKKTKADQKAMREALKAASASSKAALALAVHLINE